MIRVENHSTSTSYGVDHTPSMNLGFSPGAITGTGRSLVGWTQTPYGIIERTSNTTKMGDVMLRRGANFAETMALLDEVGHQNGMFTPSTGMMSYQNSSGKNVTVSPILGQTARDQIAAIAGKNCTPVAWRETNGQVELIVFHTVTRELKFEDHSVDTLKMGRKMVESGVDLTATRALLRAVGSKTDCYDQYTGAMTFKIAENDVTVIPLLDNAERAKAVAATPNGTNPVVTMIQNGQKYILAYNPTSASIEKHLSISNLPANIANYTLNGSVPYGLKNVDTAMAKSGVLTLKRLSIIAYMKEQGVFSVMIDSSSGAFMVTLNSGETIQTGR